MLALELMDSFPEDKSADKMEGGEDKDTSKEPSISLEVIYN